jgi:hypothetical protein
MVGFSTYMEGLRMVLINSHAGVHFRRCRPIGYAASEAAEKEASQCRRCADVGTCRPPEEGKGEDIGRVSRPSARAMDSCPPRCQARRTLGLRVELRLQATRPVGGLSLADREDNHD